MKQRSTILLIALFFIVGCTNAVPRSDSALTPVSDTMIPTTTPVTEATASSLDEDDSVSDTPATHGKLKSKVRSIEDDMVLIDFSLKTDIDLDPNGGISIRSDMPVDLVESSFDPQKKLKKKQTYDFWVKIRIKEEGIQQVMLIFLFTDSYRDPANSGDLLYLEYKDKKLKQISPEEYDEFLGKKGAVKPAPESITVPCNSYVDDAFVEGTWYYRDHTNTAQGISAAAIQKPIRKAVVTIQKASTTLGGTSWTSIATTATNNAGYFSILEMVLVWWTLPVSWVLTGGVQCPNPNARLRPNSSGMLSPSPSAVIAPSPRLSATLA